MPANDYLLKGRKGKKVAKELALMPKLKEEAEVENKFLFMSEQLTAPGSMISQNLAKANPLAPAARPPLRRRKMYRSFMAVEASPSSPLLEAFYPTTTRPLWEVLQKTYPRLFRSDEDSADLESLPRRETLYVANKLAWNSMASELLTFTQKAIKPSVSGPSLIVSPSLPGDSRGQRDEKLKRFFKGLWPHPYKVSTKACMAVVSEGPYFRVYTISRSTGEVYPSLDASEETEREISLDIRTSLGRAALDEAAKQASRISAGLPVQKHLIDKVSFLATRLASGAETDYFTYKSALETTQKLGSGFWADLGMSPPALVKGLDSPPSDGVRTPPMSKLAPTKMRRTKSNKALNMTFTASHQAKASFVSAEAEPSVDEEVVYEQESAAVASLWKVVDSSRWQRQGWW